MDGFQGSAMWTRRRALAMGAKLTGAVVAASSLGGAVNAFADDDAGPPSRAVQKEIEAIIGAQGSVSSGVFSIEIDRNDINNVTLHGVPIKPSFEINGDLVFQSIGGGAVAMNSDFALKPSELDPFIRELIKHDIIFQAEHQHMYDFDPMVWFVHFRATGDPGTIARGVKEALKVTSTPFPQMMPKHPTTPLPKDEIGDILGASPQVGADGVVGYLIPRAEPLLLGGLQINPYLNTETNIFFEPLGGGKAAAMPDFGMIASEINGVVGVMQKQGWDVGCLYNQETDEHPQLYFSHQFKTGDPVTLAWEMRKALDMMNVRRKPD